MAEVADLQALDLFRAIPADDLAGLLRQAEVRSFAPGTPIIHQGDPGSEMYVLLRGQVEVDRRLGGHGPRFLRLVLEAGEFFGEMGLLEQKPRTASILAIEATECLVLNRPQLEDLLGKYPALALTMLTVMSRRLRALGA